MKVLVTGGSGYIGSHVIVELIQEGHTPIVIDNLTNSDGQSILAAEHITGKRIEFYQADINDKAKLEEIFSKHADVEAVMHFAGYKAVSESVEKPLDYYANNVAATLALLETMSLCKCRKFVFSSSATVYKESTPPIKEHFELGSNNPYGSSKLMIENILRDLAKSDPTWKIAILRYFNPVGAHHSGLLGENPLGFPDNLMPIIAQVVIGNIEQLHIYGGDYPTKDGTGVRDYIHVVDLAKGHTKVLTKMSNTDIPIIINLGTGNGYSVIEIVKAFEKASGKKIPFEITTRRLGDLAECYADPTLAQDTIGWKAELGIDKMCEDSWRWISNQKLISKK